MWCALQIKQPKSRKSNPTLYLHKSTHSEHKQKQQILTGTFKPKSRGQIVPQELSTTASHWGQRTTANSWAIVQPGILFNLLAGLQHTPAAKEIELKKALLLGFVFFCCSAVQNYYCLKKTHSEIRTNKTVVHICWHKVARNTFTRSKDSFKEGLLHTLFSYLDQPIFIDKKIVLPLFRKREGWHSQWTEKED